MFEALSKITDPTLAEAIESSLQQSKYEVRFSKPLFVRIVGVQEGALVVAIDCQVFKKDLPK